MSYASSVCEAANIIFVPKTKRARVCFYHITMFIRFNTLETCGFNIKKDFRCFYRPPGAATSLFVFSLCATDSASENDEFRFTFSKQSKLALLCQKNGQTVV